MAKIYKLSIQEKLEDIWNENFANNGEYMSTLFICQEVLFDNEYLAMKSYNNNVYWNKRCINFTCIEIICPELQLVICIGIQTW